ncbi:MAG: signal peptidase II [Rhodobacteraceae bacterium PARR1]|jgi:signal peptidase II|nr:MAG: signal peptidase II [Rhodobacterales bacterium RIFCSPHIGHO2_02_FULL_62_130]OHC56928.1 MAG: signal peptidase II [Rhodobacterales bacterium RIFCSPHIGHO2_12_FULL_62_75]OYU17864.1 MAG: signal peptidase II [Rhodobacteraceae bacterium PARR1]
MTRVMLISLIAAAVVADQLTKTAALSLLSQGTAVPVLPGFNLSLGFNTGASFGMMGGFMAGKPLLMAALTGALTIAFAVMAFRAQHALERAGFALVVGGALGNIIDRLRQGAVTDFLDFYWRDWHWPTFNVADICITLGAVLIFAASLPLRRRKEPVLDQS